MATVLSEGLHTAEFLISEAPGFMSREAVTIQSGANLTACTVLGHILHALTGTYAANGGNTGNGAMGAITIGEGAEAGVYTLKITKAATNAGDFEVTDPQGDVVGVGTVGQAFAGGGLSFTLADGATDFAVGDHGTITVAAGGKYVALNLAATDGSEHAAGVLYADALAASADVKATAVVRSAEVNGLALTWPVGITDPQKAAAIAELAELNGPIIVR